MAQGEAYSAIILRTLPVLVVSTLVANKIKISPVQLPYISRVFVERPLEMFPQI